MQTLPNRYETIAAFYKERINRGAIRPGDRLPSVRAVSREHSVSPATAQKALRLLERDGYVELQDRVGAIALARTSGKSQQVVAQAIASVAAPQFSDLASRAQGLLRISQSGIKMQMHLAHAASALYPTAKLARGLYQLARRNPELLGGYPMQAMWPDLAVQLAKRGRLHGLEVPEAGWLATSGTTESIALALRATCQPGDWVAVESPIYFGLLQTLDSFGLRVLEIPCTWEGGLSMQALALAVREFPKIRAIVVTPSFQNPLGSVMSDADKKSLVRLAEAHQLVLIEDDVFGELAFSGDRPTPLKAWDTSGRVIYCGSFTKTLAPALRVGWLAGGQFHTRIEQLKLTGSNMAPPLAQALMADFMESGAYEVQLRALRRQLAEQMSVLREAVLTYFPKSTRIANPTGGTVLWVELPEGFDAMRLLNTALKQGISFAPGLLFSMDARHQHGLRLSVGHGENDAMVKAVKVLGKLAARQLLESRG